MRHFNHIGLPTDDQQPGEVYVAETKVWVTKPNDHRYRVEFLRFEPDSPVSGPVRDLPHIAFRVDDLSAATEGKNVLLGPFEAVKGLHVVFTLEDEAVFEYMHFEEGHESEGFL